MKQLTFISILLLFICNTAFGQVTIGRQVIGSTGSFATGTSMTLSSTVGEAVIHTLSSGNILITQGFQQPTVTSSASGIITYTYEQESCIGAKNGAFISVDSVVGCLAPYAITSVKSILDTSLLLSDISLGAGDYIVTVVGVNGCIVSDTLNIDLKSNEDCSLKFYSGITPNGDGINDVWIIDEIEQFPDNTVQIFNRWGNEVWVGQNYDNTTVVWDGLNKTGTEMATATYFYVVVVDGVTYNGWVELTR